MEKFFKIFKMSFSLVFLIFSLFPVITFGMEVSEDIILKKAIHSSPLYEKLVLQKNKSLSSLRELRYKPYDWRTSFNLKRTLKDNPELSPFEPLKEQFQSAHFFVEKRIPFGLQSKVSYFRNQTEIEQNDFLKSTNTPDWIRREEFSIDISLDLLRNAFGTEQIFQLKGIHSLRTITEMKHLEDLEQLGIKALEQYWKTYVQWVAYQQGKTSLKIYETLVRVTKNKERYSFLRPGEVPQVLAEYERVKQLSKEKKQTYEDEKQKLMSDIGFPEGEELTFKIRPRAKPPNPTLVDLKTLRPIKILQTKIQTQRFHVRASKSRFLPYFKLIGRGGYLDGSHSNTERPLNLKEEGRPFYEFMVQFSYSPFSRSDLESFRQKKYELSESEIDLDLLKRNLKYQAQALYEKMAISYEKVLSAEATVRYQKQAFKEFQRSFKQGRVDIFELISAENKLMESEIQKARSYSEYSLIQSHLKAFEDKLLEDL